jgi:hypothetical protein
MNPAKKPTDTRMARVDLSSTHSTRQKDRNAYRGYKQSSDDLQTRSQTRPEYEPIRDHAASHDFVGEI